MTSATIIPSGNRFLVVVTHPEKPTHTISCATRAQAEIVELRETLG